jgi:hypothetical protein
MGRLYGRAGCRFAAKHGGFRSGQWRASRARIMRPTSARRRCAVKAGAPGSGAARWARTIELEAGVRATARFGRIVVSKQSGSATQPTLAVCRAAPAFEVAVLTFFEFDGPGPPGPF